MRRLLVFISFLFPFILFAEETPVTLILSTYDQVDSVGFNLVQTLPEIAYEQILKNHIILWDSPKKEDRIDGRTLQGIEKSSETSFRITNQLFIHETWTSGKKVIIKPLGFYFSNKKANGEEVSYGYVEYSQLDSIFQFTLIPTNADGSCSLTYDDALKQKLYNYSVVQYGNKNIITVDESNSIKEKITSSLPKRSDAECKVIKYLIETSKNDNGAEGSKNVVSKKLFATIEKYLTDNTEFFLNNGGDRIGEDSAHSQISVNKIEMEEYWVKTSSRLDVSIYHMTVFVNDKPLNPLSVDDIQHLELLIGFKSVIDVLKEKEFNLRITKINNQDIPPERAKAFLEALNEHSWSQLIEYVKYR